MPRRNLWPELLELELRLAELQQRHQRAIDDVARLTGELHRVEQDDRPWLAQWIAGGERGARPAALADRIRAEIAEREVDRDACDVLTGQQLPGQQLEEIVGFVSHHRKRLARRAGDERDRSRARVRELVDELERGGNRCGCCGPPSCGRGYPQQVASAEPPTPLALGQSKVTEDTIGTRSQTAAAARIRPAAPRRRPTGGSVLRLFADDVEHGGGPAAGTLTLILARMALRLAADDPAFGSSTPSSRSGPRFETQSRSCTRRPRTGHEGPSALAACEVALLDGEVRELDHRTVCLRDIRAVPSKTFFDESRPLRILLSRPRDGSLLRGLLPGRERIKRAAECHDDVALLGGYVPDRRRANDVFPFAKLVRNGPLERVCRYDRPNLKRRRAGEDLALCADAVPVEEPARADLPEVKRLTWADCGDSARRDFAERLEYRVADVPTSMRSVQVGCADTNAV